MRRVLPPCPMRPNARVSVMGGSRPRWRPCAASVRGRHTLVTFDEEVRGAHPSAVRRPGNPYYSTARLWDDLS